MSELDLEVVEGTIELEVEFAQIPEMDVDFSDVDVVGFVVAEGAPGPKGQKGDKGDPGNSFGLVAWWSGHGEPGAVIGSKPGDFYTDLDTGTVYKLGD